MRIRDVALKQRLALFTDPAACWLWWGKPTAAGYGRTTYKGRHTLAHRAAYLVLVGPIPEGMDLDHLCRNRLCMNPAHLEPVPHRINMERSRRTHCRKGHPFDEANTYWYPPGSPNAGKRACRQCFVEFQRTYRERGAA